MSTSADLEIGLHRRDSDSYAVDFRFNQPDSDTDVRLGQGTARFDLQALGKLQPGSQEYSQALTSSLFSDPAVQTAFAQALTSAQTQNLPLRVRLLIGPSAPELQSLHWETLNNPQDNSPMASGENLLFSRYLSSLDWRPVPLRPKADMRALVVISNPSNLSEYQNLAAIDVEGELARAREALGNIPLTLLPDPAAPDQYATLNNIAARLRDGAHDILYLVCHGAISQDAPFLWFQDDSGKVAITSGDDLVTVLRGLSSRPRLVVLASCQSAGNPTMGDALTALGPRMSQAGIPAVIAMQGSISLQTIAGFMPVFFTELQRDGLVDRALSVARSAVRQRPDYWMPALFLRLKSGRIWYVPGFGDERSAFEKWPSILRTISRSQCTPILGPALYESVLGSQADIARRWAEAYHYPMAPQERESLPQVSQYLTVNQYERAPYDELADYLKEDLSKRYADKLPPEMLNNNTPLDKLVETIGLEQQRSAPHDAYKVLAELPLPVYITTNHNNLMAVALKEAKKDPQVVLCPWNDYVENLETIYNREPDYQPSADRPLVYHLFGRLDDPDTIVLTEDDYFDFLIGVTRNKDLIPGAVRRALADTALLFLGFRLDDWQFRVLFRSILSQQGGERRGRYPHIAAQIEPEEGRILEPERARRYLETYFARGANISLFWGSVDDFVTELETRWQTRPA
jgi:hypothetical protein